MKKIRPITLEIDKDLWDKFKKTVPREIRLVDRIAELIDQEVKSKS